MLDFPGLSLPSLCLDSSLIVRVGVAVGVVALATMQRILRFLLTVHTCSVVAILPGFKSVHRLPPAALVHSWSRALGSDVDAPCTTERPALPVRLYGMLGASTWLKRAAAYRCLALLASAAGACRDRGKVSMDMRHTPMHRPDQLGGLRWCLAIGLSFGVLLGVLWIIQTVVTAADWAKSVAEWNASFPPDYTGYRDLVPVGRSGLAFWLFTSAVAGAAGFVLYFIASQIVAQACQQRSIGILASLVVDVTGWALYLVNVGLLMPHLTFSPDVMEIVPSFTFDHWPFTVLVIAMLCAAALAGWAGAEGALPRMVPMPLTQRPGLDQRAP